MPALPIIAAVGVGVAAVGTVASIKNQKKMLKEQQKATRFERQKNQLQNTRQKIEAVRQTRLALGQATQNAENQGVAFSSSAQGGQGSIVSQGNANLSFLDQYGFLTDQAQDALGRAATYQSNASMWSSVAGLGSSMFQMAGGFDAFGGRGGGSPQSVGPTPPSAPRANSSALFTPDPHLGWSLGR